MNSTHRVVWNELVAADEKVAGQFYSTLFDWQMEPFAQGQDYTLFKNGDEKFAGMMKRPEPGMPSHWLPYVAVANVDATIEKTVALGGKVLVPALDIPNVGRIAVFADPQGAAMGIIQPNCPSAK